MAVGTGLLPPLIPVAGVRVATESAGIKYAGRPDLVLFELAVESSVAATFTRNAFCAAPVSIAREHWLGSGGARYWLINTGNANAGTGMAGLADANRCCSQLAELAGIDPGLVMPFSTGVIGEPLPVDRIVAALPLLLTGLAADGWPAAAEGILTTDTRRKGCSRAVHCEGHHFVVTGIAKGAGMIRPNMATMLAFLATDAVVEPDVLQAILSDSVEQSFNRITVDGDTSTNDACVLVATGAAQNPAITASEGALYEALREAVADISLKLAQDLIRDGEGAGKFVEVSVSEGSNESECLQVAYTVAESPLVKTALFASDPNWGRILAAIGRAGVDRLDVNQVTLHIGDTLIAERGMRATDYLEAHGLAAIEGEEIRIRIGLGRGDAVASVWTTDLGHDYVRINAEYRT